MKLSITQIVSGVLIVLASCYIMWWMIFGAQSLLTMPVPDRDGIMQITRVFPEHEALFSLARYASGLLLGLGIVVLSTGVLWKNENTGKKAVVIIVAGALVASVSVFIMTWGYPIVFSYPMPEGSNLTGAVNINPGPLNVGAVFLTVITAILGMVVSGVGITWFVKTRR